jgi:predicted dehydrogenase
VTPLRFGVLGCADIARRRMLPAMTGVDAVRVVAIAGRDAERTERMADSFGCVPVHGYAALLERSDVDAVYIPLPAALHARWTEAALRAGKHVLAEKPLTTSPAATRALLDLAGSRGLVLRENVMFVNHGQHTAVRKLIADGAIGELRSLRAVFTVPARPDGDIRHDPELGGGALLDTGVYPVRAALHLLGDALRVVGASLTQGPGRAVDTSGAALLRTPEGVTAQLEFGLDHGYRSSYEVCGSTGRLSLDHAFIPPAEHRPQLRLTRGFIQETIELAAEDQVTGTVLAFAEAVRAGWPSPAGDGQSQAAVLQARLLEDIRTAAASA